MSLAEANVGAVMLNAASSAIAKSDFFMIIPINSVSD